MLKSILEQYNDEEISTTNFEYFNDAIIGIDEKSMRLIYSVKKCYEILCKDMTMEDAVDHFGYNVSSAYYGEKTPIWCYDDFDY